MNTKRRSGRKKKETGNENGVFYQEKEKENVFLYEMVGFDL
jgi:hypothetical protein